MPLLDVSDAEALDKLTILNIKRRMISDPLKLQAVIDEFDTVSAATYHLTHGNDTVQFWCEKLEAVNLEIWNLLGDLNNFAIDNDAVSIGPVAIKVQLRNNSRARIKRKIDEATQSSIIEQKGYASRKLYILPHTGMGDMIICIGLLNYMSTVYDEICVPATAGFTDFMSHNRAVRILPLPASEVDLMRQAEEYKRAGYDIIRLGIYAHDFRGWSNHFFTQFYCDAHVPVNTRKTFFHIARDLTVESEFATRVLPSWRTEPYAFVHDKQPVEGERCQTIPKQSLPAHLAQFHPAHAEFAGLKHYCSLIENASELHMLDSSFSCLATYLDLSKVKRLVVYVRTVGNGMPYNKDWENTQRAQYAGQPWEFVCFQASDELPPR